MKIKSEIAWIVFVIIAVVLLTVLVLLFMGPVIGDTFSTITESLSGDTPPVPEATVFPTSQPMGTATPQGQNQPLVPETRRLTLEYPLQLKAAAESDIVRLTLEVDSLGNITPTAVFEGNVIEGEIIEIPNLYDTHNVTVEAQFDMAGLEVKPPGATFQPLKPGEKLTFNWSIRAQEVGTYRGTIWLYLNFEDRSTGEKSRSPISAQIVEIEAVDFFGFSVNFVRTSGVVGSVLGLIVGFPFFDDIVKYLWEKRKKGIQKVSKQARKK